MTSIYEGMFLLDNQVVRQDWSKAKKVVTDLLTKHGATIKSARRWDERQLAYPIKRRNRATYLLTYTEIPNAGIIPLRRDLELSEDILRYLFLSTDTVPQEEIDLTSSETSDDFVVPLPPEDHEVDAKEEPSREDDDGRPSRAAAPAAKVSDDDSDDSDSDDDDDDDGEA